MDGEAEDKVRQIVTVSEREAAETAQCDRQPIRRQILAENGTSGKTKYDQCAVSSALLLTYLGYGLA